MNDAMSMVATDGRRLVQETPNVVQRVRIPPGEGPARPSSQPCSVPGDENVDA
jgi:hypothetical protein